MLVIGLTHFLWKQVDVLFVAALWCVVELYQGQSLMGRGMNHMQQPLDMFVLIGEFVQLFQVSTLSAIKAAK